MPTLILLRHAKAEYAGPSDFERELAPRGHEQLPHVAAHLAGGAGVPDLVLCSGALRTRQTWAGIAAALEGWQDIEVHYLDGLYSTTPEEVHQYVSQHGRAGAVERILVVGHEPIMSMTAASYAGEGSDRAAMLSVRAGMPTASLAVIELPDWGSDRGRLQVLLRT